MSKIIIPANYTPALNLYDTQRAIGTVKRLFADTLCATLNLYRVSARTAALRHRWCSRWQSGSGRR